MRQEDAPQSLMSQANAETFPVCSQAKKDATELQEKSKSMKAEIVRAEEAAKEAEAVRDKAVTAIGNLVHDSVPVSNDEVELRTSSAVQQCISLNQAEHPPVFRTMNDNRHRRCRLTAAPSAQ